MKEKLKMIVPGKTYPREVVVTETFKGKLMEVKFLLQSYMVGMYCAIHVNGGPIPMQTGDHNNKSCVTRLKKDIAKAIERGAKVEISAIVPIAS